jgi:excisionase family DNA binding protein
MQQSKEGKPALTLSVLEAGEMLGVGRDAAYQAVRAGVIPALRIGRCWRIPRAALEKMLSGDSAA